MSLRTVTAVTIFCGLVACEAFVSGTASSESEPDESGNLEASHSRLLADGGFADIEVYGPGTTLAGWEIYDADPDGGRIQIVADSVRGNVYQFTSLGTDNGFRLRKADLKPWNNTRNFNISWWQQFSSPFIVYVDVNTTDAGQRYLTYTATPTSTLGDAGHVHHGLGSNATDGTWRLYQRDLMKDLKDGQPNYSIQSVNGFLIRGSGKVDDITLQKAPFSPPTITSLSASATDVLWGNVVSLSVTATPANAGEALTYVWSASHGTLTNPATATPKWTAPSANVSANVTVRVFGPNGLSTSRSMTLTARQSGFAGSVYSTGDSLTGWSMYDADPPGAILRVVASGTTRGNVVELVGSGIDNGAILRFPAPNTKNFTITFDISSANAVVYVDTDTTEGQRYLTYTLTDTSPLASANYVQFGLGSARANNQWQSITRDLQADYRQAYPLGSVLAVKALLIRGSGKVDTVQLGAPICQ